MRRIYQRYATDCFPTCVAMIADISWRQAMWLIHPFHLRGYSYNTYDHQAVRALRSLGFKVRKRYIGKDFTKLKQPTILIIDGGHPSGDFHVAVWDPIRKRVLEPSRRDRYLPLSFYKERLRYVYLIS
jgi:ABC-type bacteriocin/lantibiotic exporter with double-glycine peptidase domain